MTLAVEYKKQYKWRDWQTAYSLLPRKKGQTILDLGCGIGDQARDFAASGYNVIGIDGSEELLLEAKKEATPNIIYHQADLRDLNSLALPQVDGIWISYTTAYFPDLEPQLKHWSQFVRPGGWIAMIEVDDLFAHGPMDERARAIIEKYYASQMEKGVYDFRMGRKLKGFAEKLGLHIDLAQTLPDTEFCFKGPASSAALDAWKARLNRLTSLHEFCGDQFAQFRMRLMACLIDENHRSSSQVHFVVAKLPNLKIV